MIKPIAKKNLYREVFNYIIEQIAKGELLQGERLAGEIELAEAFQVSRNSVREALKSLEVLDIVISKSGTGTVVSDTALRNIKFLTMITQLDDDNSMYEMWESRLIIEPELTYRSIQRATESDIVRLEKIVDTSLDEYEKGSYKWGLGKQFHDEIAAISQNTLLQNFLYATVSEINAARVDYILHMDYDRLLKEIYDHKKVVECFMNKDAEGGKAIMKNHLAEAMSLVYGNV